MATRTENANSDLVNNVSTDARIRAFVNFIDATLTAGGWVNTSDTGQTAVASFAGTTTTNEKAGYRIYRMDDALQATAPVFMRLDFGEGNSADQAAIWITLGTGSDGAGNITGVLLAATSDSSTVAQIKGHTATTTASHNYGSAGPNRCAFLMFVGTASGQQLIWALERTKDSSGADTADGLLLSYSNSASSVGALRITRYIRYDGLVNPALESGVNCVLSNANPSSYDSNVGIGLILHFAGTVQQPGINIVVTNSSDFTAEAVITMSLYGVTRTYVLSDGNAASLLYVSTGAGTSSLRASTRVGILYE